jgi:O-antigen/teichoic acid export membrane protein
MNRITNSVKKIFMPFGMSGNIYLIGALGQGLGPIFLTPVLTRVLDTKTFGEIAYVTSAASLLGILFSLGLPIVISRNYVLEIDSRASVLKWFKQIIFSYVVIAFILILFINESVILATLSMSFGFACMQLILPLARAQNKATQFAIISTLGTLLPGLTVIFNSYFSFIGNDLIALVMGSTLGAIISSFLIWTRSLDKKVSKKFSLISSIKSSYPVIPHMFAMIALLNIDKIIFGQQVDKAFSGYIQVIMLIGTGPILILNTLGHAWLNQTLTDLKNDSKTSFRKLNVRIFRLCVLSGVLVLTILFLNKPLLKLLNPNISYSPEIQKTIVLTSICSFIYVVYIANTHLLLWLNKFWVLSISTPLSVILQAIIIYSTINSLGYLSAALAFGAALSLQIILLQLVRWKTETKSAIHSGIYFASLGTFWIIALIFVY